MLLQLPAEIIDMVTYYLDNIDYANFRLTCKQIYRSRNSTPCVKENLTANNDHLLIDSKSDVVVVDNKSIDKLTCTGIGMNKLYAGNVRYINCSSNHMTHMVLSKHLIYLNCANNYIVIGSSNVLSPLYGNFDNLRYLNCSNTRTSYYKEHYEFSMRNLEHLNCSYIYLGYARLNIFCERLQYLNCSGNKLDLMVLACPELKKIICTNAYIVVKQKMLSVTYLDCSYSMFNIKMFPSLTYLKCVDAGIEQIDGSMFPLLKTLICSKNTLKLFTGVNHIINLDCSECGLVYLPCLKKVEILNCSKNNISSLPSMPFLRVLDCTNTLVDLKNHALNTAYSRRPIVRDW